MDASSIADDLRDVANRVEQLGGPSFASVAAQLKERNDNVIGYREFGGLRSNHLDVVFPQDFLDAGQISIPGKLLDEGYAVRSIAKDPGSVHGKAPKDRTVYRFFVEPIDE